MVRMPKILGFKVATIAVLTGAMTVTLASSSQVSPVLANDYHDCTEALLTASKLDRTIAAKSCAEALHPKHVGSCVQGLTSQTVDAVSAVDACRRVRRPLELPGCVSEIRSAEGSTPLEGTALMSVVDACRKSLLPTRFGQCVSGLRRDALALPIAEGLITCLDATDYRKDIKLYPVPVTPIPTLPDAVMPSGRSSNPPFSPSSGSEPIPQQF